MINVSTKLIDILLVSLNCGAVKVFSCLSLKDGNAIKAGMGVMSSSLQQRGKSSFVLQLSPERKTYVSRNGVGGRG